MFYILWMHLSMAQALIDVVTSDQTNTQARSAHHAGHAPDSLQTTQLYDDHIGHQRFSPLALKFGSWICGQKRTQHRLETQSSEKIRVVKEYHRAVQQRPQRTHDTTRRPVGSRHCATLQSSHSQPLFISPTESSRKPVSSKSNRLRDNNLNEKT